MHFKLTPDRDGVIDLTTLDDDWFTDLAAELDKISVGPRTSGADSASSSGRQGGHDRSNKTNTLRGQQTVSPRPSSADYRRSALMSESSLAVTKPQYQPYNYADYIPRPKFERASRAFAPCSYTLASRAPNNLPSAVGLDLEWPFSRDRAAVEKVGKQNGECVHLVSFTGVSVPTFSKGFPRKVKELIESSKVPKMGVNIRSGWFHTLTPLGELKVSVDESKTMGGSSIADYGILSSNLIELGALAGQIDSSFASTFKRPIVSLAIVVSYYLKRSLDKGQCVDAIIHHAGLDASNDVHSGLMVYKSLMRTAQSSKAKLLPEGYTADLANELRQRDSGPVRQTSTTLPHPRGSEAPHRYTYTLWRQGHGLLDICIRMGDRVNPQRETVVISHIIRALTEDLALPFSMSALISLVRLDSSSWVYHRDTIERWTLEGRGIDEKRPGCSEG
ncbi:hypothetical protein H4582DRAFT_2076865 [Lactarius indigo]|nr:hypothetical protein H4582DRAFT_2076865 [Lactarius indigo]